MILNENLDLKTVKWKLRKIVESYCRYVKEWFAIPNIQGISQKTSAMASWDEFQEVLYQKHTQNLESQYGVHDWSSSPSDEVEAIGYTPCEVEPAQILELMTRWHAIFLGLAGEENVTSVVELEMPNEPMADDASIFKEVEHKIQVLKSKSSLGRFP